MMMMTWDDDDHYPNRQHDYHGGTPVDRSAAQGHNGSRLVVTRGACSDQVHDGCPLCKGGGVGAAWGHEGFGWRVEGITHGVMGAGLCAGAGVCWQGCGIDHTRAHG